jgi:hypothetical protein
MKRIGLLAIAVVLALGTLGVGYAHWTDTITVEGTVCTGVVCIGFESWGEINTCPPSQFAALPDRNWCGWVYTPGTVSCPPRYKFDEKPCTDKDVAWITFKGFDADGNEIDVEDADDTPVKILEVTVNNAYPHFLGWITFEVCNCGTIPVIIQPVVIEQSPFLLIEYRNGAGEQLEPENCHEVSLYIGVVQNEGYYKTPGDLSSYVVDDPNAPLLEMNHCYSFNITVSAEQWYECDGD